jgi:uncharacterized protein
MISERIKYFNNKRELVDFYFWRSYSGQEIDLVEVENGEIRAFEFKWGDKIPKLPTTFKQQYPNATFYVVNKTNFMDFVM